MTLDCGQTGGPIPRRGRSHRGSTALEVVSRVAAAVLGGYLLASLASILLSLLLIPLPRAEAVTWSILPGFALHVGAVIWVFAAQTARRAWFGLGGACLLLAGLCLALAGGGSG